jgi:hypothetical protein
MQKTLLSLVERRLAMANVLERIKFGSETKGPAALAMGVGSNERGRQAAWIGHGKPELLERCD